MPAPLEPPASGDPALRPSTQRMGWESGSAARRHGRARVWTRRRSDESRGAGRRGSGRRGLGAGDWWEPGRTPSRAVRRRLTCLTRHLSPKAAGPDVDAAPGVDRLRLTSAACAVAGGRATWRPGAPRWRGRGRATCAPRCAVAGGRAQVGGLVRSASLDTRTATLPWLSKYYFLSIGH